MTVRAGPPQASSPAFDRAKLLILPSLYFDPKLTVDTTAERLAEFKRENIDFPIMVSVGSPE
jgi:hypothetical protein